MPVIPYTLQRSVFKTIRKRKYWRYEYERILVDVSDEVAAFLEDDDKRERRYQWKIKKQMQRARIHRLISLDKIKYDDEGESYLVADLIEDTFNPENRNPLSIIIQNEDLAELIHEYSATMTKKQYEVFQLYEQGYNNVELAELLKLDESSVRERLHTAFKAAVMAYLTRSNFELFLALHNEFKSHPENANLPKHKFNEYLGVLFINRLSWFRHDQMELINFVLETDYDAVMKKYFLDFITKTPETPP